jgi:hypothetical protein
MPKSFSFRSSFLKENIREIRDKNHKLRRDLPVFIELARYRVKLVEILRIVYVHFSWIDSYNRTFRAFEWVSLAGKHRRSLTVSLVHLFYFKNVLPSQNAVVVKFIQTSDCCQPRSRNTSQGTE